MSDNEPWGLPANWSWATFRDVAEVASDLRDPKRTPDAIHIAPNHIESGRGRLLGRGTVDGDRVTSPKHAFRPGQVLYSKIRPYLAKAVLVDFEGLCSADMYPVSPLLDRIEPRFLHRWLVSPAFTDMASQSQGRTVLPKINQDALYRKPVPVPPLTEQKRIADKLDALLGRVDACRERLDRVPGILKRLRQSVLDHACAGNIEFDAPIALGAFPEGWAIRRIEEFIVSDGIFDGARDHGSKTPVALNLRTIDYTDSGVRVIRLENLAHLRFINEKRTYISEAKYAGLRQNTVGPGDVLVGSFIEDALRVCAVPQLDTLAIAKADCFCVRPRQTEVLPEYLAYQLATTRTHFALSKLVRGATRPRITTRHLRDLEVPICSLAEQRRVISVVRKGLEMVEAMEVAVRRTGQRVARLPESIVAKAFRGELVPQDPDDEAAPRRLARLNGPAQTEAPS